MKNLYTQSKKITFMLLGLLFLLLEGCQTSFFSNSINHPSFINPMKPNGSFFLFRPTDQTITAAVYDIFSHHEDLASLQIRVETQQGVVILSGYVKTIRQSDIAGAVAASVSGVKSVENNIIVRK